MDLDALEGKTILAVRKKTKRGYDDTGYLEIQFTDGTSCIIVSGFDADWTGLSEGEYATTIGVAETVDDLVEPEDNTEIGVYPIPENMND